MGLGLFQQGNNLLPFDAGEAVEKNLNGIACFKMVEKTFHRHAGTFKNRFSPENFRVLHDDLAHKPNLIFCGFVGELNSTV